MSVKNKRILRQIAKEWCKAILLACETDAFEPSLESGLLDADEVNFIVDEAHNIAERITTEDYNPSLNSIVKKYFKLE